MNKGLRKFTIMKVVGTIVYLATTAVLAVVIALSFPEDGKGLDVLAFLIVIIAYCLVGLLIYLVPMILGIVGIVLSKRIKDEKERPSITYFAFMIALPILTVAILFSTIFLL